jgi:hypothetical protein
LCRPRPISKVPRGYPTLPRSQRQGMILQRWRSCPPPHPEHGRTTQAQLALGRSLQSCKGDRTRLLPPPDARRRRHQQLVEHRPALSILRLVYTTTPGAPVYTTTHDPFAVSGLRVQAPVSGLLYSTTQPARLLTGPRLQRATKDSSSGLLRDQVLLDPAHAATNGSTAVSGCTP